MHVGRFVKNDKLLNLTRNDAFADASLHFCNESESEYRTDLHHSNR